LFGIFGIFVTGWHLREAPFPAFAHPQLVDLCSDGGSRTLHLPLAVAVRLGVLEYLGGALWTRLEQEA
jgi:hypothetical protein